jgi:hypothetical protein
MRHRGDNAVAVVAALDASIAEAAAPVLRNHGPLTTGKLIPFLLADGSLLTAESDPGRRKQVERALRSERAKQLGIECVDAESARSERVGRRPRSAWRITPRHHRARFLRRILGR